MLRQAEDYAAMVTPLTKMLRTSSSGKADGPQ